MDLTSQDARGRFVVHAMWTELEKIAMSAVGVPGSHGALEGGIAAGPSSSAEEASPAYGIVASRVEQLDPKRAHGIPILRPPPGYVYSPELTAFVPDQASPGWMSEQEAMEAARNRSWYEQGQSDLASAEAQQEMDSAVAQQAEGAIIQRQQAQQQAAIQQAMALRAQQKAMDSVARKRALEGPASTAGITDEGQSSPMSKKPTRGVTIKIGR